MSTSKLLKKNCDILKFLYKGKPSIRDYIIKNSNKELINCFHKICLNILYKKIKLTKNKVHKFSKYRKALNGLIDKKKSIKSKCIKYKVLFTQLVNFNKILRYSHFSKKFLMKKYKN